MFHNQNYVLNLSDKYWAVDIAKFIKRLRFSIFAFFNFENYMYNKLRQKRKIKLIPCNALHVYV